MEALSDEELIARYRLAPASETSRPLIEELFRRHQNRVVAGCFRLTGNRTTAVDLAQDVFAKAYSSLDAFRARARPGPRAEETAARGGGGGGATGTSFTLSIGRSNKGTVTSDIAGINCGNSCSAKYPQGTTVTVTATPPAGLLFLSWGGACSGTAPTCSVTLTKNTSVQANFSK